jgi:hypothetical protein
LKPEREAKEKSKEGTAVAGIMRIANNTVNNLYEKSEYFRYIRYGKK